tara:strand:+ start:510 stop:1370 length:861 start_codon:yes stop_codon:yes gene_type:complete
MKVSVIICIYNPKTYLVEQINSIVSSFNKICTPELIISDDSTQDHSSSLLDLLNIEFSYLKGPASGSASDNFFFSLTQVDSDWVFLSDQDDTWSKVKVSRYLEHINSLDENIPQIIFSDAALIDSKGRCFSDSFFAYQGLSTSCLSNGEILLRNCVQGATLCINKKMIELVNESLKSEDMSKVVMHDWWIAILAHYCGNWTFIDEPLLNYRQHDSNVIGASKDTNIFQRIFRNPRKYLTNVKNLKKQYQLWLRVSERLGKKSRFKQDNLKGTSFIAKIKLFFLKWF